MNKLYYAPGACSIGIHVLLEEIGKPYQAEQVDLRAPAPQRIFTNINAKSKVPTLERDDGSILTEFPAIAFWLARTNPEAGLLPDAALFYVEFWADRGKVPLPANCAAHLARMKSRPAVAAVLKKEGFGA